MPHRQARGLARMESILDAAEDVIVTEGWGNTTTNRIAAQARISPGSLYQYFGSKDGIASALISRASTSLATAHAQVRTALEGTNAPWGQALDTVLDPLLDFHRSNPWFPVLMKSLEPTSSARAEVTGLETGLVEAVSSLLEDMGRLQRPDSETVARALLLVFRGFTSFSSPQNQQEDFVQMKKVMTAYWLSVR